MILNIISSNKVSKLILALVITVPSVLYSQKDISEKAVSGSIQLKYTFPANKSVKYQNNSKVLQTMDINGQTMQTNVISVLGCSVRSEGREGNDLKLEIRIDTMAQIIDSPNGYSGGPVTDVLGKVFKMLLSPSGKEKDISEAEKIVFTSQASGQGNAGESFFDFFPDLPKVPVHEGYTWISNDTVTGNNPGMSLVMIIKAENKFEGMEKYNGRDCAKISSILSGSRDMKMQAQGMDIKIKGPLTGSGILYFDPAAGYFLKYSMNTKMKGIMEITSPDIMSFPVLMDISSDNIAVK
jgi:hypothetical protein